MCCLEGEDISVQVPRFNVTLSAIFVAQCPLMELLQFGRFGAVLSFDISFGSLQIHSFF